MKILAISDIHVDPEQPEEWGQFLARAQDEQPDVIIVAGDLAVGKSGLYETLLSQFDFFAGPKLFVPGNHDLWQLHSKRQTWKRYDEELPAAVSAGGWQYLDLGPVLVGDVGIVGCMGWYDYSLRQTRSPHERVHVSPATVTAPRRGLRTDPARGNLPWEELGPADYATKALHVGDANVSEGLVWNDVFYIDWQRSDDEMVTYFCDKIEAQARQVARRAKKLVAVTHFVPFGETLQDYNEIAPAYVRAYAGSARLGDTIRKLPHITAAIFGHWHAPGKWDLNGLKAWNVAARHGESTGTLIRV
jgi:hypothetical protein